MLNTSKTQLRFKINHGNQGDYFCRIIQSNLKKKNMSQFVEPSIISLLLPTCQGTGGRGFWKCHLHRSPQNFTLTHTHAHTPHNIPPAGPPDSSNIWRLAVAHQPTTQVTSSSLVWFIALQAIIQAHASFYVAVLEAPITCIAISEGIIS